MTNLEFNFHGELQCADSHNMMFDRERIFEDGRELRAIYDSLLAVAHGVDAMCEKLDRLCSLIISEGDADEGVG